MIYFNNFMKILIFCLRLKYNLLTVCFDSFFLSSVTVDFSISTSVLSSLLFSLIKSILFYLYTSSTQIHFPVFGLNRYKNVNYNIGSLKLFSGTVWRWGVLIVLSSFSLSCFLRLYFYVFISIFS